jgi:uncharacterized membrane protein
VAEFSNFDLIALGWFFVCYLGYSQATKRGLLANDNIISAIRVQRLKWMMNMVSRPNRVVDTQILMNLSSGNAFFASTSVIVLGGLAALLGTGERVNTILSDLPFVAHTSLFVWKMKVLLLLAIFVVAFFKFAWAFRLSHYTAIMVGATPLLDEDNEQTCRSHAERTAELSSLSANHSNAGLRAYYFAMALLGWFIHPILFMAATAWVVVVLYRREYRSKAFRAIAGL